MADLPLRPALTTRIEPTITRIIPSLAQEIGLNESIILSQLSFWITHSTNLREGKWWTYQSLRDMQSKAFGYWSVDTIRRTIKSLQKQSLIYIGNFNKNKTDRTQWFALNTEGINQLKSIGLVYDTLTEVNENGKVSYKLYENRTPKTQNRTALPEIPSETPAVPPLRDSSLRSESLTPSGVQDDFTIQESTNPPTPPDVSAVSWNNTDGDLIEVRLTLPKDDALLENEADTPGEAYTENSWSEWEGMGANVTDNNAPAEHNLSLYLTAPEQTSRTIRCATHGWQPVIHGQCATCYTLAQSGVEEFYNFVSGKGDKQDREYLTANGWQNGKNTIRTNDPESTKENSDDWSKGKDTAMGSATSQPDTEGVSRLIDVHQAMGEAIIAAFGWVKEEVSAAMWGLVNKANKELRDVGAKPEDIAGLHAYCKAKEWTDFTPRALSKWYSEYRKSQRQPDEPFLGIEIK